MTVVLASVRSYTDVDMARVVIPTDLPVVVFADGERPYVDPDGDIHKNRPFPEWQRAFLTGDEAEFTYAKWVEERINQRLIRDHIQSALASLGRWGGT